MGKEIVNQVQEAQRVPYRINPRRNTSRHILIKVTEVKHEEKILKAAREKQQVTYKGKPTQLTADVSDESLQATEGNGRIYSKYCKRKTYDHDYYTRQRSHSILMEKSKALWTTRS